MLINQAPVQRFRRAVLNASISPFLGVNDWGYQQ
jgi:hypothetical protein